MYHGLGTTVNQAFEAVGDIGRNMPELSTRAVDSVRNTFSNLQDSGLIKAGMGLLRLRQHQRSLWQGTTFFTDFDRCPIAT